MYNKLFKHFKKPNNGKNRLSTDKDNENRNSTKTNESDWLPESQSNYSTSGMPIKVRHLFVKIHDHSEKPSKMV